MCILSGEHGALKTTRILGSRELVKSGWSKGKEVSGQRPKFVCFAGPVKDLSCYLKRKGKALRILNRGGKKQSYF